MKFLGPEYAFARRWLVVAVLALAASGFVQRHVERRRIEANLTWADPEKHGLEVGFLALGGFRGILADMLWIRAITNQDAARHYELKLLCDMILKLQPTFTHVHAFQAYNMSYNLAFKAQSCDDKWYWIRSGLTTLEKGLERSYRNYNLWFELGYQYFDRLGDVKLTDCRFLRRRELPALKDLTEDDRKAVFLGEEERKRRWAETQFRPSPHFDDQEHLRYAAYYFWKAMETATDPTPLRTERVYGDCIEKLGHWWPSPKPPGERRNWDDWGAEDWWVELRRRNADRGMPREGTVITNLKFCLYQQMDYFAVQAGKAHQAGNRESAMKFMDKAVGAHQRFLSYFPEDQKTMEQLLKRYRDYREGQRKGGLFGPDEKQAAPADPGL